MAAYKDKNCTQNAQYSYLAWLRSRITQRLRDKFVLNLPFRFDFRGDHLKSLDILISYNIYC
jgi:hypothetical protein